ncbi:hypothetical protein AAVH_12824 [Aphelenchoides avenae]|nr:hypothetical protein AAVH_12824 [Aphelenchus avenae]
MIATYAMEYTLSAQVHAIKGHEMFFECPSSRFQPARFAANMKSLKWPHGKVKRATRIPEPAEAYAIRTNEPRHANESDSSEGFEAFDV